MKAARAEWAKQIDDAPDISGRQARSDQGHARSAVRRDRKNRRHRPDRRRRASSSCCPSRSRSPPAARWPTARRWKKSSSTWPTWARTIPNFPKLQLNAGSHRRSEAQPLTAPIPDRKREARELLGDQLEIIVGIGPKSVIVAGGKDAEGLLKKVIDGSAQAPRQGRAPLELNVSLSADPEVLQIG